MNAEGLKSLVHCASLSLADLRSLREFCALNESAADVFDELTEAELEQLTDRLFTVILESPVEEDDECLIPRCALQCLSNGANRCRRFGEVAWRRRPLTVWRALLRHERLRLYALAALTGVMRTADHQQQTSDSWQQLFLDLLSLWMTEDERQQSWIAALFANCLQEEHFMEREFRAFGDYQNVFLAILNTLLNANDLQKTMSIHPANIQICVHLLTLCLELLDSDSDADKTDDRLLLLLEILSSAATIRPAFDQILHSETDFAPIERAVAVLKAVPKRFSDNSCNRTLLQVVRSEVETGGDDDDRLVVHLRSRSTRRPELKQASLQLVGHLCSGSIGNQRRAGDLDALGLVLHCARLQESDRPFQVQWAVLAVRHLCVGCPENQERLFAVDRVPSCVIDGERLLESMGLQAVVDAVSGQVRLTRLNDRPDEHQSS